MPNPANGNNGASSIVDSAGNPINVGSVVKLTAVVTAINAFSSHYAEVQIQPLNPVNNPGTSAIPQVNTPKALGLTSGTDNQSIMPGNPIYIAPQALTLGS